MKKFLHTALVVAVTGSALAQSSPPPQQIDVHNLPGGAKVVDQVIVPVPNEIFGILDKIGNAKWHDVLRPIKGTIKAPGPREQTALLLGNVIAEGFIAVEDKNAEEVKNIGRSVLALSEALGVKKVVVPRSNAIIQGADNADWTSVRRELDKAQREVQEAMRELNDEPLSQLVSLGGWLRGTQALCEVVKQFSKDGGTKDGAELLHQPVLADHFLQRIDGFKGHMKDNPLVIQIKEGLQKIRPLMGTDDNTPISEKDVDRIKAISDQLILSINPKKP